MPLAAPRPLSTSRLTLKPASRAELDASILPPPEFAAVVRLDVPADWPPEHWDAAPVAWLVHHLASEPHEHFWHAWFITLRRPESRDSVIGTIGFKGPPGPTGSESDGVIEIGYSVVRSQRRRGIASEAVGAMLAWASEDPRIRTFRAHTLARDPASSGVLLKNRFVRVATLHDPDDGEVDRFERPVGPR